MKPSILIVDDEPKLVDLIAGILDAEGYETSRADSVATLNKALEGEPVDAVLLDLKLGDENGLDLLPSIKKLWPETEVIVLTGYATIDAAVEATKRGAYHFQSKPVQAKELLVTLQKAIERKRFVEENSNLRKALASKGGRSAPIFKCPDMKEVVRTIEKIAPSDVSVLITGESGTGKEVIADLIHDLSPRAAGPIVKINCAALPRELIESELFGSVKGAFTGAHSDREGLFRQAEGGTLLLDELSEMPVDTQSKLLRVLQEREVRPVGGRTVYKTNCRVIAATNRKTEEAIKEGKLREDLFYRISAVTVYLPPLRERREDILPLAQSFLKLYSAQAGRIINAFSAAALDRLRGYDWPGNVRQLQNEIQRAVLMCEGSEVQVTDLSLRSSRTDEAFDTSFTLMEGMERNAIVQMLKETGGNKLETARRLGIGRQTLYNKIKAFKIQA
ncbi:MAG: sigma-54-dependent Fis family transcriptional regulator [Verrucomicrobia bacterium]|nr:sigma-54-dependent Fis family transcriptional regulator [Verrucomicrobiota bacterium]